jgi:hypothetical protein
VLGNAPDYADCPECGTSVPLDGLRPHHCDERHLTARIAGLAAQAAEDFDLEFRRFLATPQGRFERFYAARDRGAASQRGARAERLR